MSYHNNHHKRHKSWSEINATETNLISPEHTAREAFFNQKKVQILTPREKPKPEQVKICSECSQRLTWLGTPRRWICYDCSVTFDENYTKPLVNIQQAIRPIQSDDPYTKEPIFFRNIEPKRSLQGDNKEEGFEVSGNLRKAYIKTKDLGAVTEERIRKALAGEEV